MCSAIQLTSSHGVPPAEFGRNTVHLLRVARNIIRREQGSVMADTVSMETRSRIMASIRGRDTRPEIAVRRILWRHGLRYRTHDRTILGRPDISNKGKRLAIFVDGCFWHGCPKCYREPETNRDFWRSKVEGNRRRREIVRDSLERQGFRVVEIWEHETGSPDAVMKKIGAQIGEAIR